MELSIVIPIYNAEKYLYRCIDSITKNKEENIEIILINDGSKDNSSKICEEFIKRDKRLKYIYIENKGCSNARNLGINMSLGRYIWFIDSDDFIEKDAIKKILLELKKEPEVIIFGTRIKSIKNRIDKIILPYEENKENFISNQMNLFNAVWNKVYKKEVIKNNKIYFLEKCHMGEDMTFNFKYFYYIKRIDYIKRHLYNYCLEEGVSYSVEKRMEIFRAFDELFKFYKDKEIKNIEKILRNYYKINAIKGVYKIILQSNLSKETKKFFLKKSRIEIKKRKKIFKTQFLSLQIIYLIGYILINFYFNTLLYKNKKGAL